MAEETMNPAVENVEAQPEAPKAEVKEIKKAKNLFILLPARQLSGTPSNNNRQSGLT